MDRAILEAVARADVAVCWLLAMPWRRIALSLLIAFLILHVLRAVIDGER